MPAPRPVRPGAGSGEFALGPSRALQLAWQESPDGSQRLVADLDRGDAPRLLRGAGLWYLDVQARRIGQVDAAAAVLDVLARAPALLPEQVGEFRRQLALKPPARPLPEPVERGPLRIVDAEPTAVLVLRTERPLRTYYSRRNPESQPLGCARLAFDYGPVRVPAAAQDASPRRLHQGSVFQAKRRPQGERGHIERLQTLGLADAVAAAYECALDRNRVGPGDYVLRPDKRRLPLAPEDWRPSLRALAEIGVRLEYEGDFPRDELVEAGDWHAELREDGNAWFELSLGIDIAGERVDLLPILRRLLADPRFPLKPAPKERPDGTWRLRLDEARSIELPLARLRALIEPLLEWLQADRGGSLRLHRTQAETIAGLAQLRWRGDEALRRRIEVERVAAGSTSPPWWSAPPAWSATGATRPPASPPTCACGWCTAPVAPTPSRPSPGTTWSSPPTRCCRAIASA